MLNLNRLEIIGNLTRDPEVRFTPTNQAVANFAVATNRRYQDQAGTWVDSPAEFHEIVVWGKLAERVNQVLHKGERVYISGRVQTRSWEAQDGTKKYKTELIADSILGPDLVNKNLGGEGFSAPEGGVTTAHKPVSKKAAAPASDEEINIDDIPF